MCVDRQVPYRNLVEEDLIGLWLLRHTAIAGSMSTTVNGVTMTGVMRLYHGINLLLL